MDAYQIWHRHGDKYRQVADVQANDPRDAVDSTQNNESIDDPHEGQWWIDQAGVVATAKGNPRSTTFGDVIMTPDGQELMVVIADGGIGYGLRATEVIREQGYVEWLAIYPNVLPEPEMTPQEQASLFHEWRDDASQQPLAEKGVDYSDAPYREVAPTVETQPPGGRDYADALNRAIERSKLGEQRDNRSLGL